jgi:hypothetical protein
MYFIQFSTLRAVEYTLPQQFDARVRKWLFFREGENSYLLGQLVRAVEASRTGAAHGCRMFTVEDESVVVAAGMLLPGNCFCMSWATEEISETLISFLRRGGCQVSSVYAPGNVSSIFSERWAAASGQSVDYGRSERVYQVSRVSYTPASGTLRGATAADEELLLPWMRGFVSEAALETAWPSHAALLAHLVNNRMLYLWCDPHPVAMAAWVRSEGHSSINFVYVRPIHRGKGYAKAVTAGLASHILASGSRHCFILADTHDELTNHLYASIGGHPVSDLLRCTLRERPSRAPGDPGASSMCGPLNISNDSRFSFS